MRGKGRRIRRQRAADVVKLLCQQFQGPWWCAMDSALTHNKWSMERHGRRERAMESQRKCNKMVQIILLGSCGAVQRMPIPMEMGAWPLHWHAHHHCRSYLLAVCLFNDALHRMPKVFSFPFCWMLIIIVIPSFPSARQSAPSSLGRYANATSLGCQSLYTHAHH